MMTNLILLITLTLLPAFISIMFIPYWTRKTESFGVSIPADIYDTSALKSMRKKYTIIIGVISLLTICVFLGYGLFTNMSESMVGWLVGTTITLFMIISFMIYLIFHQKMKQIKSTAKWGRQRTQKLAIHTQFRQQKLRYSNNWFIVPFVLIFSTIILTFLSYEHIPEKIPMQYNFQGEITNFATKSYRTVLALPITQLYLILIFIFVNTLTGKAKQQLSTENPEKSMHQNTIFRRRWSAFTIFGGIILSMLLSTVQLSFIYSIPQGFLITTAVITVFAIIIWAFILSYKTGQGGSRVTVSMDSNGKTVNRDDDRYWKLGQFYVNKDDPTIFIEKRFGIGWTMNWGRPISWVIVIGFILITLGIVLLTI
ncbi:DUF1648 domain-containing protein [Virgibacillus salexigens]|uniref:DUF1648 domain-containing protein n=1 Tax=Virgibacillus salexigens TaxID=61016 RepID=UPI001F43489A|nr:DUF5808 domain-containing protein [Virgibacillus salexigens]